MTTYLADLGASNSVIPTATFFAATGVILVNSIYPLGQGPIGATQTLASLGYSTRALYVAALPTEWQSYVPAGIVASDEADFVAFKTAENRLYLAGVVAGLNWSAGTVSLNGHYVINKKVDWNILAPQIIGACPSPSRGTSGGQSSVSYNGTAGTIDAPIAMFDFWTVDEAEAAPSGRVGNNVISGVKAVVRNVSFSGNAANLAAAVQGSHDYIQGIRIRRGTFSEVVDCNFGNGLYDGVVFTGPQLFPRLTGNQFYNVHRDAIASLSSTSTSTTIWIKENEFGYVGRYAILLDGIGSVDAKNIIKNNSFEHVQGSIPTPAGFFAAHPEHWVQGIIAGVCMINCDNSVFEDNRTENLNFYDGYFGTLHLFNSSGMKIISNSSTDIILSGRRASSLRTSAGGTFFTANGFMDITDSRNYQAGYSGDFSGACDSLTIKQTTGRLFNVDGVSLGSSFHHSIEDSSVEMYQVTVKDGTYGKVVDGLGSVGLKIDGAAGYPINYSNATITDFYGQNYHGDFCNQTRSGDSIIKSGKLKFGQWAATTAYVTTPVANNQGLVREFRVPLTENGYFYQCTTGGTSNSLEPTWGTTIGGTTPDNNGTGSGAVVWKCVGLCAVHAQDGQVECWQSGQRVLKGAAPSTGLYAAGDRTFASAPAAGGSPGSVCTTAGFPGTWKAMANLAA